MAATEDQQIQIKLISTEEKYSLDQNVFSLSTKSSCTELQDLIKNLLDLSEGDIDFTFQVGEKILQNSIGKYCEEINFSGESILEIKYFESLKVPEEATVIALDDWVGGVSIADSCIYAGLYNGQLARIGNYSNGSPNISLHSIHEKPIKSVAYLKTVHDSGDAKDIVVTSSLDHTLCFTLVSEDASNTLYEFRGHTATVTCSSGSPSSEQLASGSWDNYLKIWSTSMNESGDIEQRNKRKKSSGPSPSTLIRTPLITLGGHSQAVTGCCWKDNIQVITTSMDMSVKLWDTQALTCVKTLSINSSLQCVDWSEKSQLIVTGSSDKYIRLFELRGESGTIVHSTLLGNEGWVPCVKWSPTSDVQLISGSYDGRSLLWDIRTPKSYLAVLGSHEDKILCTDSQNGKIVTGGADNKIRIVEMP